MIMVATRSQRKSFDGTKQISSSPAKVSRNSTTTATAPILSPTRTTKSSPNDRPKKGKEQEESTASSSSAVLTEVHPPSSETLSSESPSKMTAKSQESSSTETSLLTKAILLIIVAITYFTYPETLQPIGNPTVNHVWYYGWISALSTGLGVLPLVFSSNVHSWWIGVTNGAL